MPDSSVFVRNFIREREKLKRNYERGFLSAEEYDQALNSPLSDEEAPQD